MTAAVSTGHRLIATIYNDQGHRYYEIPDGLWFHDFQGALDALTPAMLREDAENALSYFDAHRNEPGAAWVADALRDMLGADNA